MSDLTKYAKGKRMVREDLIKKIGEGSGAEYTAGTGIVIEDNEVSIDEEVVALKDELPAEVEAITPTGEETTLEGLKIGDTSYKVGGDKKSWHSIRTRVTINSVSSSTYDILGRSWVDISFLIATEDSTAYANTTAGVNLLNSRLNSIQPFVDISMDIIEKATGKIGHVQNCLQLTSVGTSSEYNKPSLGGAINNGDGTTTPVTITAELYGYITDVVIA